MNWNDVIKDFDASDLVVIVAAVIAAGASIISDIRNRRFKRRWNQKQIDADIKAKARIEWIQKVRENTAELIKAYYSILNSNAEADTRCLLSEAKVRSELLALCFGDVTDKKENDNLNILRNKESNDGKNAKMVEYLDDIHREFEDNYLDYSKTKQGDLKRKCDEYLEEVIDVCEEDEENEDEKFENYERDEQEKEDWEEKLDRMKLDLSELRCFISIYLKIEWDRAKKGE